MTVLSLYNDYRMLNNINLWDKSASRLTNNIGKRNIHINNDDFCMKKNEIYHSPIVNIPHTFTVQCLLVSNSQPMFMN